MDNAGVFTSHEAFLSRIEEQFGELANEIGEPYRAEAWADDGKAVLRVSREGEEDDALRVEARLLDEKLTLSWERQVPGDLELEVVELVALGWKDSEPDVQAGLDSYADYFESDYWLEAGKVSGALRAAVLAALKTEPGFVVRLPVMARLQREPVRVIDASFDPAKPGARDAVVRAAESIGGQPAVSSPEPDIGILRAALEEAGKKDGLQAAEIFEAFIKAAESGSRLTQRDVTGYVQGVLAELYLFHYLSSRRPTPSGSPIEGDALKDVMVQAKAGLFEESPGEQKRVAQQIVGHMRIYYAAVLKRAGVADDAAGEMVKSAFGNAGTIVKDAVEGLSDAVSAKAAPFTRAILRRNSLER